MFHTFFSYLLFHLLLPLTLTNTCTQNIKWEFGTTQILAAIFVARQAYLGT